MSSYGLSWFFSSGMRSMFDRVRHEDESNSGLRWVLGGLTLLCLFEFFWALGTVPFYTRGEAREGLVVWEMFKTGNWILPRINGDYIPFKPPMFHWVGVLASLLVGDVSELTLRVPSAIFATLTVVLVYFAGTRLWNKKTGATAAVVLATNQEWWQMGSMAQVDMTLAFFITAALLAFYFGYQNEKSQKIPALAFGSLLAFATLAKGPLGLVLPLLILVVFLGLRRDFASLRKMSLAYTAMVFLLIAGSWYALALREGGSAFFLRQIVEESFGTAGGNYGHHQPFYYFIPVFFLNLAPWSFFSPFIAVFLYRRRGELSREHLLFPLVWLVVVLLFFSSAAGKRGVYILPLYPAFALLFAAWWQNLNKEETAPYRWVLPSVNYFLAIVTLIAVARIVYLLNGNGDLRVQRLVPLITSTRLAANIGAFLGHSPGWIWLCLVLFTASGILMLFSLPQKKWHLVLVALALFSSASTAFLKTVYYPTIAGQRSMKSFGIRRRENADTEKPLAFYQAFDYGTIFYSRRHIPEEPPQHTEPISPIFLLVWEEDLQPLRSGNNLQILDVSEGRGPVDKHRLVLVKSSAVPAPFDKGGKSRRRTETDGD